MTFLTYLMPFFSLYTLPYISVGLTSCIPIVFSPLNILTHLPTMPPVGSLQLAKFDKIMCGQIIHSPHAENADEPVAN